MSSSVSKTGKEFLRVKIDLPSFQLEVSTRDPKTALIELRKILEVVNLDEEVIYEEFVTEELKSTFSETFIKNSQVMNTVKKLLKQEDDYRVSRMDIPVTATLDLENNQRSVRVQRTEVKRAVTNLTSDIDGSVIKQGIIHIGGKLNRDGKLLIVDYIHQQMPTAQLRAFQSDGSGSKVTVECIFFGEFPEED